MYDYNTYRNLPGYFLHVTKYLSRKIYARKIDPCGRGSAHRNPFIGRALVDALTSVHLKSGPPLFSLSLLEIARFLKLGAAPTSS